MIYRLLKAAALSALSLTGMGTAAIADCDSGEIVIRFSHVNRPVGHPIGEAAATLEERVNQEMNGKACMEVFSNSVLYTDDRVIDAMLAGDVQMAAPSFGKVDKYTRQLRVFSMPFVFKNLSAVEDFQNSLTGELMKNSMIGKGVRGIGFWHNGMNQLSASKPLLFPTDAEGLRMRSTGSDISNDLMNLIGAEPSEISFIETYSALEEGRVDGVEETWANIEGRKLYTLQEGVTETNHSFSGSILVVANTWWKDLPNDVSSALLKIVQEVSEQQNERVFTINENARQAILDDGGTVRPLSEDRRRRWADAFAPVWQKYADDVHPFLIRYIQAVNARN
ncbi:MAG: DctP family TRAP transporter solute-binding subunit [Pseudomonadota bacterium]